MDDEPRRVATGWLDADLLVGAEAHDAGPQARGQYHPATVHWRLPDGGVGWLRLVHRGPTRATAGERRLDVECRPHRRDGPQPLRWDSNVEPSVVASDQWSFPGLEVAVATDATLTDPATRTYAPAPGGATRLSLAFR